MAAKANVGDGQKPCRQTNDVSSLKDESVCGELPFHLTKMPAGIVETAIDADTHALTLFTIRV